MESLDSLLQKIRGFYEDCVAKGGVLVVQPDHILSLKLMHIDLLLRPPRNGEEGPITGDRGPSHDDNSHWVLYMLGRLQDWLAEVSRDVLDESDEILHPRYQLVYAVGKQIPVDGHPDRWTTIQHVFTRLQVHAVKLQASFPEMLEIDTTLSGFPTIRILDSAIFRKISSLIIDDALRGALPNLTLDVLPLPILTASRRFVAHTEVSDADRTLIHSYCAGTTLFNGILLLRGLLMDGCGILGYVLKEQRWRVNYGLDTRRTLLAVPYHAKVCYIFRVVKNR